jgi:predicted nucleic acid-binding protein
MRYFLDTNVLVYWLDEGPRADTVETLLQGDATISVQVLNELANVLVRKRGRPTAEVADISELLLKVCRVQEVTVRTHRHALALAHRYQLSVYDACICAAAIESGCGILYSEDMQHGLSVDLASAGVLAAVPKKPKGESSPLSIRNCFL